MKEEEQPFSLFRPQVGIEISSVKNRPRLKGVLTNLKILNPEIASIIFLPYRDRVNLNEGDVDTLVNFSVEVGVNNLLVLSFRELFDWSKETHILNKLKASKLQTFLEKYIETVNIYVTSDKAKKGLLKDLNLMMN